MVPSIQAAALWGGMLVNTKQMNPANNRTVSHPSNFVPITIKRPRA